jgi:hypothetical protein
MAYDYQLGNRIRERLQELPNVEEKEMMGGLVFMLNDTDWRSVIVLPIAIGIVPRLA